MSTIDFPNHQFYRWFICDFACVFISSESAEFYQCFLMFKESNRNFSITTNLNSCFSSPKSEQRNKMIFVQILSKMAAEVANFHEIQSHLVKEDL